MFLQRFSCVLLFLHIPALSLTTEWCHLTKKYYFFRGNLPCVVDSTRCRKLTCQLVDGSLFYSRVELLFWCTYDDTVNFTKCMNNKYRIHVIRKLCFEWVHCRVKFTNSRRLKSEYKTVYRLKFNVFIATTPSTRRARQSALYPCKTKQLPRNTLIRAILVESAIGFRIISNI